MKITKVTLAILLPIAWQSAQAGPINSPKLIEGDSWNYQTVDMWSSKVISQAKKTIIGVSGEYARIAIDNSLIPRDGAFVKPTSTESTVRADGNTTFLLSNGEQRDVTVYKWPLEVGQKWTSQYQETLPYDPKQPQPLIATTATEIEVKDWETVDVPAGKFKAIKIVYSSKTTVAQSPTSFKRVATSWYSPEVKGIVQFKYETYSLNGIPQIRTNQQLTSYSVN